jgi:hypothetical protein
MRIHAGTDGCCWAGGPGPALPGGATKGNWDFGPLNQMVGNVRAYGGSPVLNVRYAPNWMWTCTAFSGGAGVVRDQTFTEFGDYVARLVSYYNVGRMTTESGTVITNPAGIANRITYWELWNEPDLSNEDPCHPANWGPALTPAQYLAMWNATAPKMLAIDPSIKLVGPAIAGWLAAQDYVPLLVASATNKPDIVSFHAYGGWENTQSDLFLFDGDASCPECGLRGMLTGLAQVRTMAQGRPVWVTELNVNAAYGNDPTRRPWNGYGAAWGASAFRGMVLGGAALLHQYQFVESAQFGMVDANTGTPLLPYWRDYYLSRAFPAGSTILSSSTSTSGVEVLAARAPGSTNVRVLVVNRQVPNATALGAPGLPGTVQLNLSGLGGVTAVTMRMLDDTTPLATGPALVPLAASNSATVPFSGYGAAILEFATSGTAATPNPTPSPTPSPSADPTATPTIEPTSSPPATATPGSSAPPTPYPTGINYGPPAPGPTNTPPVGGPSTAGPQQSSAPSATGSRPSPTPATGSVARAAGGASPDAQSRVAPVAAADPNKGTPGDQSVRATQVTPALVGDAIVEMAGVLTRTAPYGGSALSALIGAENAQRVMGVLATVGTTVRADWPILLGLAIASFIAMRSGWIVLRKLVRHR